MRICDCNPNSAIISMHHKCDSSGAEQYFTIGKNASEDEEEYAFIKQDDITIFMDGKGKISKISKSLYNFPTGYTEVSIKRDTNERKRYNKKGSKYNNE